MKTILLMVLSGAIGWALGETRATWWPTVKSLVLKVVEKIKRKKVPPA